MKNRLKILLVSSEIAPYAKTGGLADMVAALAASLKKRGHDVRAVLPFYETVQRNIRKYKSILPSMCVSMGDREEWCAVRSFLTEDEVPVYLIEHDHFFKRPGLYHDSFMNDYYDNPRRFAFFCRAAIQVCFDCKFYPDIIHANDWQASLVPCYLRVWFWNNNHIGKTASVLTIHNIAYQGVYPGFDFGYIGLGQQNFTPDILEDYGNVNFLKGGIYFSEVVNTVSPGFAREITTPYQGFGLAPYLSNKGRNFYGILNGVDYRLWTPEFDNCIPANYSRDDMSGKALCKRKLQEVFSIDPKEDICLIGTIGRFVEQKGFHLIREIIEQVLSDMAVQFVILGSGDNYLEKYFRELPVRFPGRAGSFIGYSDERAHLIEAGADFFLMPSLFEPCGLNQLYSLKYGTLPIVRATGGLDDTVKQYNESTCEGTGFKFWEPYSKALYYTIGWAVSTYYDRPKHMRKLIYRAMSEDYSWDRSIGEYEKMYYRAIEVKNEYDLRFAV